ncbi:hypothetical protein HUJ05_001102 [Dendroctonus ponderosae]|nr:hypothetical protein HUJ05_001102 [Dendroctonus ponderosae]
MGSCPMGALGLEGRPYLISLLDRVKMTRNIHGCQLRNERDRSKVFGRKGCQYA